MSFGSLSVLSSIHFLAAAAAVLLPLINSLGTTYLTANDKVSEYLTGDESGTSNS